MLLRKNSAIMLILSILCGLCGCDIFTAETEQMLAPPAIVGDMKPISDALSASVKGEYKLVYPVNGSHRSPVVLNDIDGDNVFEAFAFYLQNDGEMDCIHLNVISKRGKKWVSVFDQKVQAGSVDSVDFSDLNADGVLEIIVGWSVYASSEKQLAVYSLSQGVLSQRFIHEYAGFVSCDLDGDQQNELFIHRFDAVSKRNEAYLYKFEEEGVLELSRCNLDKNARTAMLPVLSCLSNGKPAIYINETKDAGVITEVIFYNNNALQNPLLEGESFENIKTLCAAAVPAVDIDGDSIIEIPVSQIMAASEGVAGAEKVYYTNWCTYDGVTLKIKKTTLLNTAEGYYLEVPQKWVGKIGLVRDVENRSRTICEYNKETNTLGQALVYFVAVPLDKWQDYEEKNKATKEISRNTEYVYAARIFDNTSPIKITEKEFREIFFLYNGVVK